MKRLKILILIFCVALSIPLAYFVLRTYRSLEQEEVAQLRYFAVTIFDQMEEETRFSGNQRRGAAHRSV